MPLKKKKAKKPAAKKRVVKKVLKKKIVKKPVKKVLKRKKTAKKTALKKANIIGVITHYFPHVQAAVIKLKAPLSVGDKIKIKGHTTDFTQSVNSMQIDRVPIDKAKPGQEIGLLAKSRVRQHDTVYKA